MTTQLIRDLLSLENSTTVLLESVFGSRLLVKVESQYEIQIAGTTMIERIALLGLESSVETLLFCVSYFNKEKLKEEEYQKIIAGELPVGKIFMFENPGTPIYKKNISIKERLDPRVARKLNLQSPMIFHKRYNYWIGDRKVGHIMEAFNEESLSKIRITNML